MLGCCLIYFHFRWGKLSTLTVHYASLYPNIIVFENIMLLGEVPPFCKWNLRNLIPEGWWKPYIQSCLPAILAGKRNKRRGINRSSKMRFLRFSLQRSNFGCAEAIFILVSFDLCGMAVGARQEKRATLKICHFQIWPQNEWWPRLPAEDFYGHKDWYSGRWLHWHRLQWHSKEMIA